MHWPCDRKSTLKSKGPLTIYLETTPNLLLNQDGSEIVRKLWEGVPPKRPKAYKGGGG